MINLEISERELGGILVCALEGAMTITERPYLGSLVRYWVRNVMKDLSDDAIAAMLKDVEKENKYFEDNDVEGIEVDYGAKMAWGFFELELNEEKKRREHDY